MRYYIIAGERSGDLHGGNLIRAIKLHDHDAVFRGFGGDYMRDAGAEILVHYNEMAFMGFVEVLMNFRTIAGYLNRCKREIVKFTPDVVILIDYAGFNRQIAQFAKKNGFRVFYYITPKVWAWRQQRALQLKATVDRMFVILPFEKEFFKRYGSDVDYVGNPVLDAVKSHHRDDSFFAKNGFSEDKPLIAILPGSRRQEVSSMVETLAEVIRNFPHYQFAIAAVSSLDESLYSPFVKIGNAKIIFEDTYNLLLHARAAIVTSGTATLETGLFKVPQVVVYKTNPLSYRIAKAVIKVEFISLVNLIAGKQVIKELIQDDANVGEISSELQTLVEQENYRKKIITDYDVIYKQLDIGSASENAGRLMVEYLRKS